MTKSVLLAYANTLVSMQEIIYLFRFKQLSYGKVPTKLEIQILEYAFLIAIKDQNAEELKEELLSTSKKLMKSKINSLKHISGFLFNNKDIILNVASSVLYAVALKKLPKTIGTCITALKLFNNK